MSHFFNQIDQEERDMLCEDAEWLKSIAHPIRLCIVKGLMGVGSCNVNYIKDCLELPQSTVSQHLQVLRHSGIVKGTKTGTVVNYEIADKRVVDLIRLLEGK